MRVFLLDGFLVIGCTRSRPCAADAHAFGIAGTDKERLMPCNVFIFLQPGFYRLRAEICCREFRNINALVCNHIARLVFNFY